MTTIIVTEQLSTTAIVTQIMTDNYHSHTSNKLSTTISHTDNLSTNKILLPTHRQSGTPRDSGAPKLPKLRISHMSTPNTNSLPKVAVAPNFRDFGQVLRAHLHRQSHHSSPHLVSN